MIRKLFKFIITLIVLVVLAAVIFMVMPFTPKEDPDRLGGYDNVIGNNVSMSKVTTTINQIALLGAHDAFSSGIKMSSGVNTNEDGIIRNGFVNTFGKGLIVKFTKTQNASAKQLLFAGVRYFDVRVTLIDGVYYCVHSLLSGELKEYVKDITEFLKNHPKEFVIFDIQHFYTPNGSNGELPDADYENLYKFLEQEGLFEYINYTALEAELGPGALTYLSVTNVGTKGGVVLLSKNNNYDKRILKRDGDAPKEGVASQTIRSRWHDCNSTKNLVKGIEEEYNTITTSNGLYNGVFRINQAQLTAMQNDISVIRSIFRWSLLHMSKKHNAELVKDKERFMRWLNAMPIFMVDYSQSTKGDFNKLANEYIAEYNRNI